MIGQTQLMTGNSRWLEDWCSLLKVIRSGTEAEKAFRVPNIP